MLGWKFFTDAFKKKAAASKIGNEAMTQIYKIIANSGYGFWGLRVKDKDCVKIQKRIDLLFIITCTLTSCLTIGK